MTDFFDKSQFDLYASTGDIVCAGRLKGRYTASPKIPAPIGKPCIILVFSGELKFVSEDKDTTIKAPSSITVAFRQKIQLIETSDDFEGWVVIAKEDVISSFIRRFYPLQSMSFEQIRRLESIYKLDNNTRHEVEHNVYGLYYALLAKDNSYHTGIVSSYLDILLFNHTNLMIKSIRDTEPAGDTPKYGDIVNIHDLLRLLTNHVKEHPDITFYAEKLKISKQRLALLTKNTLKCTISDLIAQFRLENTLALMRDPTLSLQQISDIMSFSDQAAFGKFFKKHKGMSPREFRKNGTVNSPRF